MSKRYEKKKKNEGSRGEDRKPSTNITSSRSRRTRCGKKNIKGSRREGKKQKWVEQNERSRSRNNISTKHQKTPSALKHTEKDAAR